MFGLVGGAFLLAGAEAALVARRRPSSLWRRLLRAVAYAACVSVAFGLLAASAIGGCIRPPFYFYAGAMMAPGALLTLLGFGLTSWALRKWQWRGNGSDSSDVSAPSPSDNRP